jgi:LacI family transcriptional regulator
VISGIEQVANEQGYHVIICMSNNSFDKEVINMELLANGSIDGFIISVAKETQQKKDYHHLTEVINQGMPLVMFDRVIEEINCDKVIIDDVIGAKKAVQRLIDLGCKNIAIISTVDYISVGKLRTQGYIQALNENDIEIDQNLILKVEDFEKSEEEIKVFLADKDIDGLFAVNEHFAIYAIKAFTERGLKIPEDVSVIGFTNGELSKLSNPGLTTVSQHGAEMGAQAASLLIKKLESTQDHDEAFQTIIIETGLVERNSTKH